MTVCVVTQLWHNWCDYTPDDYSWCDYTKQGDYMSNASKCRDYYQKTKQDPEKLAALRVRRAKNQRERRARLQNPSSKSSKLPGCSHPVTTRHDHVVTRGSFSALEDLLRDNDPVVTPDVVTPDVVTDLEYEERAAIMEYDGGLSRAEAEFEAATRSTEPLVPVVTRHVVTPLGGKHAATVAQGDVSLTADQLMEAWRNHWKG